MQHATTVAASPEPSSASSNAMSVEQRERVALLAKLCASFPATPEPEVTLEAMRDETADIPLPWLREGLRRFRDSGRTFLPSVPEVRTACAEAVREARRAARGEQHPGVAQAELDVRAMLAWARERAPLGFAQVHAIEWPRAKREALEAGNRDAEKQARRTSRRGGEPLSMLDGILGRLRVVDDEGREMPVAKIADEIATEGVLVPPKGHTDRAYAMQGRWLATCLAMQRLGLPPVASTFSERDWERADRAMTRHRDESSRADASWWFDGAREDWWRLAKRNGQGGSVGR